jgi:sucrose-6-phosphate hydrolase SacC (GH32 family)
MSNWDYASKYPSPIWRGQMSAPRELQIIEVNGDLLLTSHPIQELVATHDNTFTLSLNRDALITIGTVPNEVKISFDSATKKVTVDRSGAWFAQIEDGPQISPAIELPGQLQEFTIRTLIDHGSLELFIPEAGLAMTALHTLAATEAILQNPAN